MQWSARAGAEQAVRLCFSCNFKSCQDEASYVALRLRSGVRKKAISGAVDTSLVAEPGHAPRMKELEVDCRARSRFGGIVHSPAESHMFLSHGHC